MEYPFIKMFLFSHSGVSIEQMQKLFFMYRESFSCKVFFSLAWNIWNWIETAEQKKKIIKMLVDFMVSLILVALVAL